MREARVIIAGTLAFLAGAILLGIVYTWLVGRVW